MTLDGTDGGTGYDDGTVERVAAPGWREVDTQLRRLAARRCALDAAEAHWLRLAKRAEIHRRLGFGSLVEYLERTLGYRPRTALERIRVAEALVSLPRTSEALEAGRVPYSTVREVSRIATRETEQVWLNAVTGKTVREVEALVAGRSPGDDPEAPGDPDLEPRHLRLELSPRSTRATSPHAGTSRRRPARTCQMTRSWPRCATPR